MKRLISLLAFALFTMNVYAQILTPAQSNAISNYHRDHARYIECYRVMNHLNMFIFAVEYECNNNQQAGWREKQYDEKFKTCANKIYKKMMKHFTASYKPKHEDLYSQNVELEEELKIKALEAQGYKMKKDQYGYRSLDLDDENVLPEKIEDAANLLETLIDR